jgi:nicotinamidase-related amidase
LSDERFNLRGNRSKKSAVALLLIDVINDMDFPEGEQLRRQAIPMAKSLAALKKRAQAAGVPVIYVNDNFGQWQSDFKKQVRHTLHDGCRGEEIARLLAPGAEDFFVLKPKSSAFFDTTLESLLRHLEVETLLLTGVAADVCILFTAHDAHLRNYAIIIPEDCVASNSKAQTKAALANLEKSVAAKVVKSTSIRFPALMKKRRRSGLTPSAG